MRRFCFGSIQLNLDFRLGRNEGIIESGSTALKNASDRGDLRFDRKNLIFLLKMKIQLLDPMLA